MKKTLGLFLLYLAMLASLACKKDRTNPNTSDIDASATLQGSWRATQQSATVNGQPSGQNTYFDGDQAVFEFSGSQLKSYDGNNQTAAQRQYAWKIVKGELILRQQFAASARVYQLSFDGKDQFSLIDSYTSMNDQIVITIRFSRK